MKIGYFLSCEEYAPDQLLEQAVAVCLEQGWLRRHAERVIARLGAARSRSARLAESSPRARRRR